MKLNLLPAGLAWPWSWIWQESFHVCAYCSWLRIKQDLLCDCVPCAVWFYVGTDRAGQGWVRAAVTLGSLSAGCEPHILCSVSWMQRESRAHTSCHWLPPLTWWSRIPCLNVWRSRNGRLICVFCVAWRKKKKFLLETFGPRGIYPAKSELLKCMKNNQRLWLRVN